jgi:hypothetical protein
MSPISPQGPSSGAHSILRCLTDLSGPSLQELQASLESAGVSKEALATCDLSSTHLWQPACGGNLTTVSAFRQIGNYSYPGESFWVKLNPINKSLLICVV